VDIREEKESFIDYLDGKLSYTVKPDVVADYRNLPFDDQTFNLIVFDPPHIVRANGMRAITGITTQKYGCLEAQTWQSDIRKAFSELWRVLKPNGTLVFKFSNYSIPFKDVLALAPVEPLFGTMTTKNTGNETRFFVFHKFDNEVIE
jgi:ubiquinone/menaquinone biosynthesis C-methylase UbiE